MSCLKTRWTDDTRIIGFFPAFDTDAPMVARFQSWKAVFTARRDQIVTDRRLVPQKLVAELDTNGVLALVFGSRVAFPVAIKARERVGAAGLQCRAENVLNHHP